MDPVQERVLYCTMSYPAYIDTLKSGKLERLAESLKASLSECRLCPHSCGVNRLRGETGYCVAGAEAEIASYGPHFGEEPPLVGRGGSGTIFFSHCTLRCVFCQNFEISRGHGQQVSENELAQIMLSLEKRGCHNINLVTPTHFLPSIIAALCIAAEKGLNVPVVYNISGYEDHRILAKLSGVVDIYLPDCKYTDADVGKRLSDVSDYPQRALDALREMHQQVGDLETNRQGVAKRGVIIRHLVLPGGLAGSEKFFAFVARELSPHCAVNIMDQYHPAHIAYRFPPVDRCLLPKEYEDSLRTAKRCGLFLRKELLH